MKTKYLESQLYKCSIQYCINIFQSSTSQQFPSSCLITTAPDTNRELSHGPDTRHMWFWARFGWILQKCLNFLHYQIVKVSTINKCVQTLALYSMCHPPQCGERTREGGGVRRRRSLFGNCKGSRWRRCFGARYVAWAGYWIHADTHCRLSPRLKRSSQAWAPLFRLVLSHCWSVGTNCM